ncbi:MAG TPA: Rv2578c family radical SAM protein [Micromonosporaceae bacterium]
MRWDNLKTDAGPVPLALAGGVRRTFDTPGFAGMTFYEIRAKSIINRVPGQSRVPFEWTINPYRGCSHACRYCLAGDTPIRMADGRSKPLARLRIGDEICGTERRGRARRYTTTTVLAHWKTVKPAFRITLDDGTSLVASGDHRFLTDRGWKHVAGSASGLGHWPFLAIGDRLMGAGAAGATAGVRVRIDGFPVTTHASLAVTSVEALGRDLTMYDVTTGTGDFLAAGVVSHNCFARNTHTYLEFDAGRDFDTQILVKVNAPELLRRELAAAKWGGGHIAMGTNVDVYQRAEGRYKLMPGIISALRDFGNPFSILTKGTLILRDLPLLREAAKETSVGLAMSVGFVDEDVWRSAEPGTPAPRRRLDAVRALTDAGFSVAVLMAPILPGLTDTDESIDATVRAVAASGATSITPLPLHLRPGAREWYMTWLSREHPDLLPRYKRLFGSGSYQAGAAQRETTARVRTAARHYGVGSGESHQDSDESGRTERSNAERRFPHNGVRRGPTRDERADEQLRLF